MKNNKNTTSDKWEINETGSHINRLDATRTNLNITKKFNI